MLSDMGLAHWDLQAIMDNFRPEHREGAIYLIWISFRPVAAAA
jgi:hypothetical protein